MKRRFDICEISWKNIYHNKITSSYDKVIAEFNYKLLNNLLCNNLYVRKGKLPEIVHFAKVRSKIQNILYLNVKMLKICG